MINHSETTKINQFPQVAGISPNDHNIEFMGVRDSKQVLWIQGGSTRYFSDLPEKYYNLLKEAYFKDEKAVAFLSEITSDEYHQVELYTYYMYGDLDCTPDIENGVLATSENFRDEQDCPSLLWNSKNINIGAHILTPRQLIIIDLIGNDYPDKAIAHKLKISQSTFDFHKKKLFNALGVDSKTGLLKLSIQHKIVA